MERTARRTGRARTLVVLALGIVFLPTCAGCLGADDDDRAASAPPATAPPPASAPVSPAVPTATALSAAATPVTDLADGRHPAIIRRVDTVRRRLTVDVIQFFIGEEAATAAREDHAPEVPPPNDIWIRNVNTRLRTLPLEPTATIIVNVHGADRTGSTVEDIQISLAQLARVERLGDGVFWLTLAKGRVTRVAEQYLP
jgi:hypothetical protein